jgi:hypothetical protein
MSEISWVHIACGWRAGNELRSSTVLIPKMQYAAVILQCMVKRIGLEGERGEEYPSLFQDALGCAYKQFMTDQPVIPPKTERLCLAFFQKCLEGVAYFVYAHIPGIDGHRRASFWDAAAKAVYEDLPLLLREIENRCSAHE